MRKQLFTLLTLLLFPIYIFAQADASDSLLKVLNTTTIDSQRVDILYELSNIQQKPELAKKYADQIVELSKKTNYIKGLSLGYNVLGNISKKKGDFDEALNYHFLSLKILDPRKDSLSIAKVNNNIGEAYRLIGDHTKALSYYLKSLATLEKLNKPKLVAISLSNIAIIYRQQKNLSKSLEYNFKSLAIREEIKDEEGMSNSYDNIGIIYYEQKKYSEAEEISLKSLAIKEKRKDTVGLATNYNNLSNIYSESGNQQLGLSYQLKSLEMRKYLNNKRGISMSYNNLGNIYSKMGDYKKALEYQLKGLELAKQINSKELLINNYESLVNVNKDLRNFEQAFFYQNQLSAIKDSMLNIETSKQIAEMQTKYDTEKKEQENQLLSKDNQVKEALIKNQEIQRNVLIFIFISLALIALLIYNRYKLKQKEAFQKELNKQQELRSKAIIEAEEKERMRIAQELHDGIGQQLSAVKLNMSSLEANLGLTNSNQKLLMKNALDLIDDSVKEVRGVSHSMMPNALLKSGLAQAVREFLNRISHTDNLKIELEINGLNERLESTTETILFRVLQELVNNIIKHSKATVVNIQMMRHDNELTLIIEDNGVGFNVETVNSNGIGLKNIQSRIEYLNGTVHFDSHIGKGTTVIIEIPLK